MNLHLLSTVSAEQQSLLPHFLEHYLGLGLEPERMMIVLNASPEDPSQLIGAKAILQRFGLQACGEYVEYYDTFDEEKRSSMILAKNTQPDDWIIRCDLDEFQEYPETPVNCFIGRCDDSGYNLVRGVLTDHVTEKGDLRPISKTPTIFEQFPIECDITAGIGGGSTHKVMAHKAFIALGRGSHDPQPIESASYKPYPQTLKIHHFKWDSTALPRMQYAAKREHETHWSAEARRYLDHIAKYKGINLKAVPALESMPPLGPEADAFQIQIDGPAPKVLRCDQLFRVQFRVRNDSASTLSSNAPNPIHLSYHWLHSDGSVAVFDGQRSKLIPPLAPNQAGVYVVTVCAPSTPGSYQLQACLVQEGVRWFDSELPKPVTSYEIRDAFGGQSVS